MSAFHNRLSECAPATLVGAQRLRSAPYMPLTPAGVDEAFTRVIHLKPAQYVAEDALAGLYTALNGYCGVNMIDPKRVQLQYTTYRKPTGGITNPNSSANVASAGSGGDSANGGGAVAGGPDAAGGQQQRMQQQQPNTDDPMELFRRQQMAQNLRGSFRKNQGICHMHLKPGGCMKGSSCQYLHPPKK